MTDTEIQQIGIIVEASVSKAIINCPGGKDREERIRVLEHEWERHKGRLNHSESGRTGFWLPFAYSTTGGLIVAVLSWALGRL